METLTPTSYSIRQPEWIYTCIATFGCQRFFTLQIGNVLLFVLCAPYAALLKWAYCQHDTGVWVSIAFAVHTNADAHTRRRKMPIHMLADKRNIMFPCTGRAISISLESCAFFAFSIYGVKEQHVNRIASMKMRCSYLPNDTAAAAEQARRMHRFKGVRQKAKRKFIICSVEWRYYFG